MNIAVKELYLTALVGKWLVSDDGGSYMNIIEKRLEPTAELADLFPYINDERNFFDKDDGSIGTRPTVGWHICSVDGRTRRSGWGILNARDFLDWAVVTEPSALPELEAHKTKALAWEQRDQRAFLVEHLPLFYEYRKIIMEDPALYYATGRPLAFGFSVTGLQYQPLGLLMHTLATGRYAMTCPRCGGRAGLLSGGRGLSGGKGTLWCADCRQTSECNPPPYSFRHMLEEASAPKRRNTLLPRLDEAAEILLAKDVRE